jgi:nicotinamidase-related amidase
MRHKWHNMKETVLVLVDLQNDYFPGGAYSLFGSEEAVEKAAIVLEACREAGIPVIHVLHEKLDKKDFFQPGTHGARIHPKAAPIAGEAIVVKHKVSSFADTNLDEVLKGIGAKAAIVCGMQTNHCAAAATRDLKARGFRVTLVRDALAAIDAQTHEKTFAELKKIADSCPSAEEFVAMLGR